MKHLKNEKAGQIVKKLLGMGLLVFLLCLIYDGGAGRVQASGWKMPEEFENLTGDGKYIQDQYFYYLDMEQVGLLDSVLSVFNGIANMLFSLEVLLGRAAVYLFFYCMTFDTGMFTEQISAIQGLLQESLFMPFFEIALVLVTVKLVALLFRRNFIGIFSECAYTIVILVAAVFVVKYSGGILDYATDQAKQIAIQSMLSMNTKTDIKGATTEEYAAIASGLLWKNIVHDPWRELEFGGAENTEALEVQLMLEEDSVKRQEIVSGKSESITSFKGLSVFGRCGMVLFYFVPIVIKGGIYAILAVAQLFFQLMAAFFLLLAPVILVVSLVPGYGTMIIETWLRKLMEFEIGIIITTLLIAFMVYLDNEIMKLSARYGSILAFLIQLAVALSLFFGRNYIFGMFQKLQKAAQSPAYANALMRNSATVNPKNIKKVEQKAAEAVRKAPSNVRAAGSTAMAIGGTVKNSLHDTGESIKNLNTRIKVAANGGTAKGLDVKTQERAYDLHKAAERRKQEREKQERIEKEREQKAENKRTAHRVKALNYWKSQDDANVVDLNAKRPKTKASRESESNQISEENVVAFRNKNIATECGTIGQSGPVQKSQENPGEAGKMRTMKKESENGKHDSGKQNQPAQNRTAQRTERKISSVSLPAPGVRIRERSEQRNRQPLPAAWKQMNVHRQEGEGNDGAGNGTADHKNIPAGAAGKRSSNTDSRRRAAGRRVQAVSGRRKTAAGGTAADK